MDGTAQVKTKLHETGRVETKSCTRSTWRCCCEDSVGSPCSKTTFVNTVGGFRPECPTCSVHIPERYRYAGNAGMLSPPDLPAICRVAAGRNLQCVRPLALNHLTEPNQVGLSTDQENAARLRFGRTLYCIFYCSLVQITPTFYCVLAVGSTWTLLHVIFYSLFFTKNSL